MKHRPRKRFGQNFLLDHGVIQDILAAAAVEPGQHWVEIGPGLGALTEPLLEAGVRLDVVELDRDLIGLLTGKFSNYANLHIHGGDALKFDFSTLARPGEKLRIIGNLPYNISTPLLFHLLQFSDRIEDMHFMLQKEVVERICAHPGGKKYGRLSVMLQYRCEPAHLFDVPPESFDPPPKVMSAVVRLLPYAHPPAEVENPGDLDAVVTQAFSQRRKTLRNALRKLFSEQDMIHAGVDPGLRAESIPLQGFACLSNLLTKRRIHTP
ncbi:MAG: 16S rRNA (adenine(1518)-N(6)/adenine(1519)-N(6))-dimethyltransferase RsmA [Gammaproteobacteria bacterium]